MAEGELVGRFFGEEGGDAEAEAEAAASALDPTAAAFAAKAADVDPGLASRIGDYFERQSRFVEVQLEHLHEQRLLNLAHLRVRRWRERMMLAFQVLLAVIVTLVVAGALMLVWEAANSRSVVVSAFKSPPVLAARGLSGDVVASGVLDGLQHLQDATRGPSKGLSTRSAWAGDVKIEVPETGVSIGELSRMLHERLGHDVHIDGDLVQRPDGGLALTIRGDEIPAKTFTGPVEDVDKLTMQAAEYVYGRSQPWQYAVFLTNHGDRAKDALAFLPGAFARARTDAERADLANVWGNGFDTVNDHAGAVKQHRLSKAYAVPYSSVWWKAWGNLLNDEGAGGDEQAALLDARTFLKAAEAAPAGKKPEDRFYRAAAQMSSDSLLYLRAASDETQRNGGLGANTSLAWPIVGGAYITMHDYDAAERALAKSEPDDLLTRSTVASVAGLRAFEAGRPAEAIPAFEEELKLAAQEGMPADQTIDTCTLALAYAQVGREADARRTFAEGGAWSYCAAQEGAALVALHHVDEAKAVWAKALARAPDMPSVYQYRGQWELDSGDEAAAAADLSAAAARAPHLADPFKVWGDLLAKEGRWAQALAKYDEGLKYAPGWPQLKAARAAAAARAGGATSRR